MNLRSNFGKNNYILKIMRRETIFENNRRVAKSFNK